MAGERLFASWSARGALAILALAVSAHAGSLPIADGTKVTLEYTLMLPDKTVAETTVGQEPVSYVQGKQEILPGLEKALTGLTEGQRKTITLSPEDAYGVYDASKKVEVPKSRMPPDIQVGTRLRGQDGQEAKVEAIKGDTVVVDVNHPLAGKALIFDVHILKVEKDNGDK
ncbi:MAG TPA: peptidylprolyl isomerase [Nitrospirales bacterium]|nr:peptidylprolyl isomerase [Nitrospirales bacterium]